MKSRQDRIGPPTKPVRTAFGLALALVLSMATVSPRAAAGPLDLGGRFELEAGGEIDWDWRSALGSGHDDDDLEPTLGLGVFARYGLHEYFSLGGEISVLWWRSDDMEDGNIDRCVLLDIAVRPQGQLPLLDGALDLYVAVPLGVAISIPSDEMEDVFDGRLDSGAGVALAVLAGLDYRFLPEFGALVELGWAMHWFVNDIDAQGADDVESTMNQFAFRIGVFYSLPG